MPAAASSPNLPEDFLGAREADRGSRRHVGIQENHVATAQGTVGHEQAVAILLGQQASRWWIWSHASRLNPVRIPRLRHLPVMRSVYRAEPVLADALEIAFEHGRRPRSSAQAESLVLGNLQRFEQATVMSLR